MGANKETLGFQAEVKQLLNLMIHSLYSNKEIFLRELISNASDACDKLRFEALNNAALYGDDGELKIRLAFDKDARTITISDNGIGLSREEAVEHLGTAVTDDAVEAHERRASDRQGIVGKHRRHDGFLASERFYGTAYSSPRAGCSPRRDSTLHITPAH